MIFNLQYMVSFIVLVINPVINGLEKKQLMEINQTLEILKKSTFRSKFKLSERDRQYAREKGIDTIKKHTFDFINSRIAPQYPKKDGKQTPMKGHPVFIAQHATATCCRGCIDKWHRIKKGNPLTEKEIDFIVNLIMAWIQRQTPGVETIDE